MSTPSPPVVCEELFLERELARGSDVVVGQTRLAQHIPLGGAGGGKDLGSSLLGDLDRSAADAASAGVDQHLLACLQPGEVVQAVVGGGEDDRQRRRLLEGPARRDRDEEVALAGGERAEGAEDHPHHPVSGGEVADLGAGLDDHSGALAADRRITRVDAEGDQDVAEVEPGGVHLDPHLGWAQGLRRTGDQGEALQRAAPQARRGARARPAESASPRCP